MVAIWMILLLFGATEGKLACYSTSLHAKIKESHYERYNYVNNENCVLSILPVTDFRIGYYLVIKWTSFEVEGNLPYCKDYVEVFLTSKQKSIGKYCSGSSTSSTLFNMYSSDGYATIRFKSDSSGTKGGFRFTYQLKSINSEYIGGYGNSTCVEKQESQYFGIFYGSGWPKAYTAGHCHHTITLPAGKAIRIAVMDLDLRDNNLGCDNDNDNFHIRGSKDLLERRITIQNYGDELTRKYCGTNDPQFFSTAYKHVYLILNKPIGSYPLYPNRGFMIGFIIYDKSNGAMLGASTASLVVSILVVIRAII